MPFHVRDQETAASVHRHFAAVEVGAASLAALRAMPAADLQKTGRLPGVSGRLWDVNVDGWFLPDHVAAIFAQEKQNDVPILVGSNAGEGTSPRLNPITAAALRDEAQQNFGAEAAAFPKLYPFDSDESAKRAQQDFHRDQVFGWPTREWARAQAKTGRSKVYFYYFNHVAPGPYADAGMAAPHGGELPFVFNWVKSRSNEGTEWRDVDRRLADAMSTYWINFAATGDPNGSGLARWPAYNGQDGVMLLGESIHGIVTSDRYSAYGSLSPEQRQICWAHLKRDFQKLVDRGGPAKDIGEAGLRVVDRVFDWWHQFRGGGLDRDQLQQQIAPVRQTLRAALAAGCAIDDTKANAFCENVLDIEAALWTFTRHEGVEPTNNHIERLLRPGVLWRKNAFGCHSDDGCRFVERILTVVQTLRLQKRPVLDFLHQSLLAHRQTHSATTLPAGG